MSNYVPHYTKKKERLISREQELLRAIRDGQSRDTLLRLAEDVRLARVRVVRAERAQLAPTSKWHASQVAAFDARFAVLEASTADAVLMEYL